MTAILSIESDTDCERFDWKRGWLQEFRLKASMNSRVLIESVGDSESFDWKFRLCVFFCVWPLEFVLLRDAEHPSCTPASLALSMAARSSLSRISKLFRLQELCFKADFSVAARCRVPFLGFKPDDCWIDCCQFFTCLWIDKSRSSDWSVDSCKVCDSKLQWLWQFRVKAVVQFLLCAFYRIILPLEFAVVSWCWAPLVYLPASVSIESFVV